MKFHLPILTVGTFLVIAAGCERGPEYKATDLEGAVTVAGHPLNTGSIQFVPQDVGQGPTVGTVIVAGRYQAKNVPLGKVIAIFTSVRRGQRLPDVGGMPVWRSENLIPEKHRNGIAIEVEAKHTKQNFDL